MGRSRTGILLGVLATTALLACNGILGLNEFSAVECTGLRCDGGVDAADDDAGDAAIVVIGTAPVSWAKWKMPNSSKELDAASATNNVVTYTQTSDGVRDNVTKLVWTDVGAAAGSVSFAAAKTVCGADARLPSRIELVTLLDVGQSPTIDPAFKNREAAVYWTSSEVRPYVVGSQKRWVVDFGNGNVRQAEEAGTALVRCIKGGS